MTTPDKSGRSPPIFLILPRNQVVPGKNLRETFVQERIEEMTLSIAQHGVMSPLRVRPIEASRDGPKYEIIDGHQRFFASEKAKLDLLPCVIVDGKDDEAKRFIEQLVLNCVREGLNKREVARGLKELKTATGLTSAKVGQLIGFTPEKTSRFLAYLDVDPEMQALVESDKLPMSTALELSRIPPQERGAKLAAALEGSVTRDQLAGARKRREKTGSEPTAMSRATASLPGGKSVTVVGQGLTLESFIEMLEDVLAKARKVRPQGVELSTFVSMLRDQSLKATLKMEA